MVRLGKLVLGGLVALRLSAVVAAEIIVLDNTQDGTAVVDNNLGSLSATTWQAKLITTPATGDWALGSLLVSLFQTNSAVTISEVTVTLRAVDGLNPTGPELASESFDLPLTATATYFRLSFNTEGWALQPSTTYALILRATAGTQWPQTGVSLGDPYETFEGFHFVATRRSLNSGTSWSANATFNGLQIRAVNRQAGPTEIVIEGMAFTGNSFQIDWTVAPPGPVNVQRRASLASGEWQVVSPDNTSGSFTDEALPPGGRAFYRVVAP